MAAAVFGKGVREGVVELKLGAAVGIVGDGGVVVGESAKCGRALVSQGGPRFEEGFAGGVAHTQSGGAQGVVRSVGVSDLCFAEGARDKERCGIAQLALKAG